MLVQVNLFQKGGNVVSYPFKSCITWVGEMT